VHRVIQDHKAYKALPVLALPGHRVCRVTPAHKVIPDQPGLRVLVQPGLPDHKEHKVLPDLPVHRAQPVQQVPPAIQLKLTVMRLALAARHLTTCSFWVLMVPALPLLAVRDTW
jgi:hypothetical protein